MLKDYWICLIKREVPMTTNDIDIINIGDKIEIYKKDSDKKESMSSQVLDMLESGEFIVSCPMKKYKYVFIGDNEIVTVSIYIENRGRYEFDALVLERYIGKIYRIKLKKISEVRRIQLRDFFRFEISIPVNEVLTVMENGEKKEIVEHCKTKDISGGGLRLLTNYKHNIGDVIKCEFVINGRLISAMAKVVRLKSINSFGYKYSSAVQFTEINENDRDAIIKYIFSKQSELRRKGLI